MTGKGEVLKAHSAMASTTSCKISNIARHHLQEASSKAKFTTFQKCSCLLSSINAVYTCDCSHTLKGISDVMVNPCVMTGSSSAVRPFQTSNSTQRQPARRTCLYISTEELPASWPAETTEEEMQNTLNYFSPPFASNGEFLCFSPLEQREELESFSQQKLCH